MAGLAAAFGSGAMTNSIEDFENAELYFVIGSNTTEQHPLIGSRILKRVLDKKTKLIVIDPRRIKLAEVAKYYLQIRPGTDIALLNGLAYEIIRNSLENTDFIKKRTEGYENFKNSVANYPLDKVSNITGIDKDLIKNVAKLYAETEKSMIVYAMGITQHVSGTNNVKALANLAMLTGHIGYASSGVNPLRGQNNVQGACDMGALPNVFSGYQPVTSEQAIEKFKKHWKVDTLSSNPGLTLMEMMHGALDGKLKALYIMGENPLVSDPNLKSVKRALKNLELLVVQDIFPTETANIAHVVLPAASFAEKTGTYTNTERRVQLSIGPLKPIGESMPDWKIIMELANRMGYQMYYDSPEDILDEINELTPSYAGIKYSRLKDGFGIQWPCPHENHPGTSFLHKEKFARGLGKFFVCEYEPIPEIPNTTYPFILITGRESFQYHTATMTGRIPVLKRETPTTFLYLNPEDAMSLKIVTGSNVVVESRRGMAKLRAKLSNEIPKGVCFASFHFGEINEITQDKLDPIAKIPELKTCAVTIRRVD